MRRFLPITAVTTAIVLAVPSAPPAGLTHGREAAAPTAAGHETRGAARPAAGPSHRGDYRFLYPDGRGRPSAAWPCRHTITVALNARTLPPGTMRALRDAAASLSAASG